SHSNFAHVKLGKILTFFGSARCSGRVEIYNSGSWGTVCNDNWDINDARVVCRQLACGTAVSLRQFAEGTGQIWLDEVACTGNETYLTECSHSGFGVHNCAHSQDAGVICSGNVSFVQKALVKTYRITFTDEGDYQCQFKVKISNEDFSSNFSSDVPLFVTGVFLFLFCRLIELTIPLRFFFLANLIRLSGSNEPCSGRVEIYHNGVWGTVCDDGWDLNDAAVACRQLDCGPALGAPRSAHFGQGTGQIWLDDLVCSGSESSLAVCGHRGFGTHDCVHGEDAGVICSTGSDGYCSGRVEIYHNGAWGTVCDDRWDRSEAQVVCRQLGCGEQSDIPPPGYFGPGTGPIWMDDVSCSGSETSLSTCSHRGFGTHNCEHYEDVGVICSYHKILPYGSCNGNVQIYHDGAWRLIDNNNFNMDAANVACRQLGCGPASSIYSYNPNSNISLYKMTCSGSESSLAECRSGSVVTSSGRYSGVRCAGHPVRLIGPSRCSGRVEIYYSDAWGTVCDNGWDMNDAQVVCRQLGCGTAVAAPRAAYFGKGMDKIWVDNVSCTGRKTYLTECPFSGFQAYSRSHSQDAGVICSGKDIFWLKLLYILSNSTAAVCPWLAVCPWPAVCPLFWLSPTDGPPVNWIICRLPTCRPVCWLHARRPGRLIAHFPSICCFQLLNIPHNYVLCCLAAIRLVGPNRCSGRAEIYNNGSWGTVCNVSKDLNDGRVLCRQLGCGTALGLLHFGEGAGEIWLDDVTCTGSERHFSECLQTGSVRQDCAHSEDLGVICSGNNSCATHFSPGLIKPTITNPQSDISFGQNLRITCLVPDGQVGGTFIFNRTSDGFGQTVESNSNSGTFYIPQIGFEHEGNYQCQFHTRVTNENFSTDLSDSVQLYSKGIYIFYYKSLLKLIGLFRW
uniref:Deleted in malignant brain tumors 1 protein n=1 Tax=Poecilia mexicana TaxID=48701 RepID=A0A3B3X1Z3_9TELE